MLPEKIVVSSLGHCITASVDFSGLCLFLLGWVLGKGKRSWKGVWKLNVHFWPGALNRQLWGQSGSFYNLVTGPRFQKRKECCMTYLFSSRLNVFWFAQKQFKYPKTWISHLFSLSWLAGCEVTVAQWKCQACQHWTTVSEASVAVYKPELLPLNILLVPSFKKPVQTLNKLHQVKLLKMDIQHMTAC